MPCSCQAPDTGPERVDEGEGASLQLCLLGGPAQRPSLEDRLGDADHDGALWLRVHVLLPPRGLPPASLPPGAVCRAQRVALGGPMARFRPVEAGQSGSQVSSGTITIAPAGHSSTQSPQPLQ